ncbi:hypothetical protein NG798_19250 [Ancylothrix sp. C2]|uniref:hypothetical protein n=1 Tax=Ancylothrix sp. D3o TaxID=2953691 RepID=UPI0021BB8F85|nr:hypothetical protein [Ancylothrix sp. D3o]MCT7951943.1 hypothetical protein [Ancylothrix sp. D3o]
MKLGCTALLCMARVNDLDDVFFAMRFRRTGSTGSPQSHHLLIGTRYRPVRHRKL